MNAEERQALREKHRNCDPGELDLCGWCKEDYPCDVIKVLDATENLNPTDLKTEVECKHLKSITVPERQGFNETIKFNFCPKCGEKL